MRALRAWFNEAVWEAIREGAPSPRAWQDGLAGVVFVILGTYLVLLALIFASGYLRGSMELTATPGSHPMPVNTIPFVVWGILLAMTLLIGAVIHLHPVLRVLGYLACLPVLGLSMVQWTDVGPWYILASVALFALLLAVRWNKPFVWWEFPVCLAVVLVPYALPALVDPLGSPVEAQNTVTVLSSQLTALALPTVLVAAYAVIQIPVRFATAVSHAITRSSTMWAAAGLLLLGVVVSEVVWTLMEDESWWDGLHLPQTLLLVLVMFLLSLPVLAVRSPLGVTDEDLDSHVERYLYPIAVGMVCTTFLNTLLIAMTFELEVLGIQHGVPVDVWSRELAVGRVKDLMQVAVGLGVVVAGWVVARRRRPGVGYALVGIGAVLIIRNLTWTLDVYHLNAWSLRTTSLLLIVVILTAMLASKLRGGPARPDSLVVACTLAILLPARDWVAEPLDTAFGMVGGSLLILGLIWRTLTDGRFTNGHSPAFPQASRLMIYFAGVLAVADALALQMLSRDVVGFDGESLAWMGEDTLGGGLLLGLGAILITHVFLPEQPTRRNHDHS